MLINQIKYPQNVWIKIGNGGESLLVTDSGENSHRQEQKDDRHRYRDIYTIFANTHVISYKYRWNKNYLIKEV